MGSPESLYVAGAGVTYWDGEHPEKPWEEPYMLDYYQPAPVIPNLNGHNYVRLKDGAFDFYIQCKDDKGDPIRERGIPAVLSNPEHYDLLCCGSPTTGGPYDHWEDEGYTDKTKSDANGLIHVRIGMEDWDDYEYTSTYMIYTCSIPRAPIRPFYLKCFFNDAYPGHFIWLESTLLNSYQLVSRNSGIESLFSYSTSYVPAESRDGHIVYDLVITGNRDASQRIPKERGPAVIKESKVAKSTFTLQSESEQEPLVFDENNITNVSWGRYNDQNEFVGYTRLFHTPTRLDPNYADPNGYVPPAGVDFNDVNDYEGYIVRITAEINEPVQIDPNCNAYYTAFLDSIDDENNVFLRMAIPVTIKEISPDGKTIIAETPEIVLIDWIPEDNWLFTYGWHQGRVYISVLWYGRLALEAPEPAGDFYFDGEFNYLDLGLFSEHWLESVISSPSFDGSYDLNYDGKVDFSDYSVFAKSWLEQE
jgi:hypothetical protein